MEDIIDRDYIQAEKELKEYLEKKIEFSKSDNKSIQNDQ
tara:strand:+ start:196 stop:312 length:117 start_codon:yes stop_codon:yes gene_type:complete